MTKSEKKRARSDERQATATKDGRWNILSWTLPFAYCIVATMLLYSRPPEKIDSPILHVQQEEFATSKLLNAPFQKVAGEVSMVPFKIITIPMKAMHAMIMKGDLRPLLTTPIDTLRTMLLIEPKKLPPLPPDVEAIAANK